MKLRKLNSIILSLIIIMSSFAALLPQSYALGEVQVSNATELKTAIENCQNFELTSDIDMSDMGVIISKDVTDISIIGNGYAIKNMKTTNGLLKSCSGTCMVTSLALYNMTVIDPDVENGEAFGAYIGEVKPGANVTIVSSIADSVISVDGNKKCYVGGLVGKCNDDAVLNIKKSASLCDIYENITESDVKYNISNTTVSYIGGLVGYHGNGSVTGSYSSGYIKNTHRYHYIGGLVGFSKNASYTNGYTSLCITNAFTGSVKSIGAFLEPSNLSNNVYYDKTVSLQRQESYLNDTHGFDPKSADYTAMFDNTDIDIPESNSDRALWNFSDCGNGFYPQISAIRRMQTSSMDELSILSCAQVNLSQVNDLSLSVATGREFYPVSSETEYSVAYLSKSLVTWRITGGTDEYYFDPDQSYSDLIYSDDVKLTGSYYDAVTGEYVFSTSGDIVFVCQYGSLTREIFVHVGDNNPYISTVSYDSSNNFYDAVISTKQELEALRVYCQAADCIFTLNSDISYTNEDEAFIPMSEFSGIFDGNNKTVSGMKIITNAPLTESAGFISDIADNANAEVKNIYLKNISLIGNARNSGTLIGFISSSVVTAEINNIMVSGTVLNGEEYSGMIFGKIEKQGLSINKLVSNGLCYSSKCSGAMGGIAGYSNCDFTDCYSSAVIANDTYKSIDEESLKVDTAGIIGTGSGAVSSSLFCGMLYNQSINGLKNGITCGSGLISLSYYDGQSVGKLPVSTVSKKTSELISNNLLGSGWSAVSDNYPCISSLYSIYPTAYSVFIKPVIYAQDSTSRTFKNATLSGLTYIGAYNFAGEAVNDMYSYYDGAFIRNSNGVCLCKLSDSSDNERILLFNSKNVRVNYIFDTPKQLDTDMSGNALVLVNDACNAILSLSKKGESFGSFLINGNNGEITFSDMIYNDILYAPFVVTAENYAVGRAPVSVADYNNKFTFNDADEIYVKISVSENARPWGIYYSNTNN